MKKIFKSLLLVMILLPVTLGFSQNTISGKIIDAENQAPLEQVSIYLPQLEKGIVTNSEGIYELNNMPNGGFTIVVSYLGYKTVSQFISITSDSNELNFALVTSAIEIEEVILSTPFHKLERENVMKVETLSMSAIQSSGVLTLAEGISNIPGVSTISTGMGIGKPVIRGLSSNRVLVYSQGIRLENQQFGDEHGLGLDGNGNGSIEVIKGPASLLYGSDAMGGVLYINPERFALPNETDGDVSMNYYSNTQGIASNFGVKTSGEKFRFLFRAGLNSHVDYKTGDNERVTNSRFKDYDIKTGIGFQANKVKSELRYNYNSSNLGIPEEVSNQTTERAPDFPNQEIGNHILSSKTNIFFDNSRVDATLGYTLNNRKEFEEEGEPELFMKLETFSYNLLYHLPKKGKWETILGVQGMNQSNANFGEEFLIPDATTNDVGVLATSHLHLNKSGFQIGLRYDNRNISTEGVTPSIHRKFNSINAAIGLRQDITDQLIGRINIASGFRAPNLAELSSDGTHEGTNRYEIGNSDLENEQNIQIDLGIDYTSKHWEFYANGFYNTINDFIFIEPNGDIIDNNDVFVYRQQNANLYGGEIGIHLHPHPLDWLHLESSFETVIGELENKDNLPLIPANSFTNTLRVELGSSASSIKEGYSFITLKSTFDQNRIGVFEEATDGYTLINLGVGGKIPLLNNDLAVRASINNLFDVDYVSHLSRLKTDGILNMGRNITIGLSLTL